MNRRLGTTGSTRKSDDPTGRFIGRVMDSGLFLNMSTLWVKSPHGAGGKEMIRVFLG